MFSFEQVDFISFVSSGAFFGGTLGSLCGLFIGGILGEIRTRRAAGFLAGALYGCVRGGVIGSTCCACTWLIKAVLYEPYKGSYSVPEWWLLLDCLAAIMPSAFVTAFSISREQETKKRIRWVYMTIAWTTLAALLGAFSFVFRGFEGYFVIQNNERLLQSVIEGFGMVGVGALVLQLVSELLLRSSAPSSVHHAKID
jgi:MFS family permease